MISDYYLVYRLIKCGIIPYTLMSIEHQFELDKRVARLQKKLRWREYDMDDVCGYLDYAVALSYNLAKNILYVDMLGSWKVKDASIFVQTLLGKTKGVATYVFHRSNEMILFHAMKHACISKRKYHIYHAPHFPIIIERSTNIKEVVEADHPLKITLYDEHIDIIDYHRNVRYNITEEDHYVYLNFSKPIFTFVDYEKPWNIILDAGSPTMDGRYVTLKSMAWALGCTKYDMPTAGEYLSNTVTRIIPYDDTRSCIVIKALRIPKFPNDNPVHNSITAFLLQSFLDEVA